MIENARCIVVAQMYGSCDDEWREFQVKSLVALGVAYSLLLLLKKKRTHQHSEADVVSPFYRTEGPGGGREGLKRQGQHAFHGVHKHCGHLRIVK
jgi:hypothetical protein